MNSTHNQHHQQVTTTTISRSPLPRRSVLDYDTENELAAALSSSVNLSDCDWKLQQSETTAASAVARETQRLLTLKSYQVLDCHRYPELDSFTEQVRAKYTVPWASVSIVDLGRQCFLSFERQDIAVQETSRHDAFCARTILQQPNNVLVIPDTHRDERFRTSTLAQPSNTHPGFRFYAGAPLISPEGEALGSLCLLDREPHPYGLSDNEQEELLDRAKQVVSMLVDRRRQLNDAQGQRKRPLNETCAGPKVHTDSLQLAADVGHPNATTKIKNDKQQHNSIAKDQRKQSSPTVIIPDHLAILPDPKASTLSPDEYLAELARVKYGIELRVKPALELDDYFAPLTEEQMAAYSIDIVSVCRNNDLDKLRTFYQERGRDCLDCFNRFGEGLLNIACRRGFQEICEFLLSDNVRLSARVRDDYGRTPLHDACWNPEPQIDICARLLALDPSLFLIADKRGYTAFQYARTGDWPVWRQFLYDNVEHLERLARPDIVEQFSS
jgi:hypothetical protein